MNLFRRRTTWSNAELAVFKAAVFTAGIIAGSYIHDRIGVYMAWLWTFTAVTSLASLYLWIKKSKPGDRLK
jgi:hypothetical protein